MESGKITEQHRSRTAYVYVRQSTAYQVEHNLESQRRQYQLVQRAQQLGFGDVRVIDEDLGVSATECTERSGFKKLVAEVGLNRVGLVLGLECARLARNNRDWYHLLDLCALFDTLIADQDGVYHPGHPNDRMLLGLKGTMSEAEVNVLKSRMLEGARNKAARGELIYRPPLGYVKDPDGRLQKDPDARIQAAIEQAFTTFRECHSVRQTLLWFRQGPTNFPAIESGPQGPQIVWKLPVYDTLWHVLTNPTYAGAYVFGKHQTRKRLEGDTIRKRRVSVERKDWKVLIQDRHPAYISWDEYERNRAIITGNQRGGAGVLPGPILKGHSVLAGLLRCGRCGRKLAVAYSGKDGTVPRYACEAGRLTRGEASCIAFGGMRMEEAVCGEVLRAVEPLAIEASIQALAEFNQRIGEHQRMVELELEATQYQAERAFRQYDKVEPENRLVCAQLEATWNRRLQEVESLRKKLATVSGQSQPLRVEEKAQLAELADHLPRLWNAPTTTSQMRKRIVRTVIKEIVADLDRDRPQIVLQIHWVGGVHTELRVKRNRTGEHGKCTDVSIVDLVRQLAERFPDETIAPILNRLKLKTGVGNNWTRDRVRTLRHYNGIPVHDGTKQTKVITIEQAAEKLGVCCQSVRKLIDRGTLAATHIVSCAPWSIPADQIERPEVIAAAKQIRRGPKRRKSVPWCKAQIEMFQ